MEAPRSPYYELSQKLRIVTLQLDTLLHAVLHQIDSAEARARAFHQIDELEAEFVDLMDMLRSHATVGRTNARQ